ncbi:MAG TPA: hypothetical protein VN823_27290 [Stellaceae bacterium]|nr:hypothetical protein [Stellaceae bacterium]
MTSLSPDDGAKLTYEIQPIEDRFQASCRVRLNEGGSTVLQESTVETFGNLADARTWVHTLARSRGFKKLYRRKGSQ